MHLETLASLVEYLDGPWDEELFVMVQSDIGLFLFFCFYDGKTGYSMSRKCVWSDTRLFWLVCEYALFQHCTVERGNYLSVSRQWTPTMFRSRDSCVVDRLLKTAERGRTGWHPLASPEKARRGFLFLLAPKAPNWRRHRKHSLSVSWETLTLAPTG